MKVVFCALACAFLFSVASAKSLKVTLYYETLCPYSIKFVTSQLYPTYQIIGDYLELDFVPFGNAKAYNVSGGWLFQCQHGTKECVGNRVHSCVLNLYNESLSAAYINCDLGTDAPADDVNLKKCAEETGIDWSDIDKCIASGRGDELLAANGDRTYYVEPKISTMPGIALNGVYNQTVSDEIEYAFLEGACRLLDNEPPACQSRKKC